MWTSSLLGHRGRPPLYYGPKRRKAFFLPTGLGCQTFYADGRLSNQIQLMGVLSATFTGTFAMTGNHKMTITFETLQPTLFGSIRLPSLNIAQGALRNMIEKNVRGGAKTTNNKQGSFQKRPNTYVWHHVDTDICVARGSSGSLALWVSQKSNNLADEN